LSWDRSASQDAAPSGQTVHGRGSVVRKLVQRLGFRPDEPDDPQSRVGGPQPGAEARVSAGRSRRSAVEGRWLGFLSDELDGPRLVVGRSGRAQRRQNSPTSLESCSREGPRRGWEILRFVLGSIGHPRHCPWWPDGPRPRVGGPQSSAEARVSTGRAG
jgi:hypothetical protein